MTVPTNSSDGGARRRAARPLSSRTGRCAREACALVLALLLAACSGDDEPPPPCPEVYLVPDARRLVKFAGPGRDLTDVQFEAALQGADLFCEYDDNGIMEGVLQVSFVASRGPADRRRMAPFTYFVAVATVDKEVVAREEFRLAVPFEGNRTRVSASEELTPRIPIKPGESPLDYRIFVGFSLSPEELRYNRDNR